MARQRTGHLKWDELKTYKEVQKWLIGNDPDKVKKRLVALAYYCQFTEKTPKQLYDEYLEDESKNPLDKQGIAKHQIIQFKKWLTTKNDAISNNSAISYTVMILSFYSSTTERRVYFTKEERRIFTKDRGTKLKPMITVEMVREIYNATKFMRDRAIILCLSSSGMPIGDLLQLKWKDIKTEFLNPPENLTIKIDVNRIKNQIRYITFFSPEARNALDLYFKREYSKEKKDTDFLFIELKSFQGKIVPLTQLAILKSIKTVVKDVMDKLITPYSFRSFFTTQMRLAKMPELYIDVMTGHKVDDVKLAYDLVSRPEGHEELRKIYIEYLPAVTILNGNNVKSSVQRLEQRLDEMEKKMDQQQAVIDMMKELLEKKD